MDNNINNQPENIDSLIENYKDGLYTNDIDVKLLESDRGIVRLRKRIDFSRFGKTDLYPDLLGIQLSSYEEFLQEGIPASKRKPVGLQKMFLNNFPIEDAQSVFQLEFIEYNIERPKYSEQECREREL